ncbi:hypothetical protein [Flavobacterium haoranii]|uniref:Uncharacterized protein n=1 Tax=Flavobacterium haoranii TaxID=683124 RepID=A0A1M6DY44_9FLAO|nr:hypothetical protein [Flavobacterium haoranii]MDK2772150.1 hypothetical protein [Flavobacterium sp.]SHI77938.1 hypothetical protein SAMN05444337_0772 [Flavobacterium haoranii]
MKTLLISIYFAIIGLNVVNITETESVLKEVKFESSFTLINDTKEKVTIHTGTGIVSLNKGSKTSIGCNVGKEVRWANDGKKGDVIFKIANDMCGETLKLSKFVK